MSKDSKELLSPKVGLRPTQAYFNLPDLVNVLFSFPRRKKKKGKRDVGDLPI